MKIKTTITTHVHLYDECIEVEGKLLPFFHAGQDFVLHRALTLKKGWTVTDRLTGLRIGAFAKTQKGAIANAMNELQGHSVEKYHKRQLEAVLKHYRDGRNTYENEIAAERKNMVREAERDKEINDLIRVMRHDEITVDQIMDIGKIAVLTVGCWE